jgi:hypothetical protein
MVSASDNPRLDMYKPGWFESWEGNQSGVLYNFWHSLDPFVPPKDDIAPTDNADVYGWYKDTFFGLANWEREVCLMDLTSDIRNVRDVITDTDEISVYTTTITASAQRQMAFNNSYLYEVSWYIRPYSDDAEYKVYLEQGTTREYFEGKTGDASGAWKAVSKLSGDSGYEIRYLNSNFTNVVLSYRPVGSTQATNFSVSVVNK